MRVKNSKGSYDLNTEDMKRFRFIENAFCESCQKWGYQEVRTPTIEYLHLFTSVGTLTPGALSKVYSFLDWDGWSGERVVLRPEGTIPAARFYVDNLADEKLVRLYYVVNSFVFEETGKENRERWQCGVELIGAGSTAADLELITLSLEVLKKLGQENVELKLSHAGIIRALLARLGLSPREQGKVFGRILDGDTAALTDMEKRAPELTSLLDLLLDKGDNPDFLRNLKVMVASKLQECIPALDNFIEIADFLTAMGQKYEIDIASGRGFEYYTGIIFQLAVGKNKIGGGGRYNALIPFMGGNDTPASGFALRMNTLMKLEEISLPEKTGAGRILVKLEDNRPEKVQPVFQLASDLRAAGYIVCIQQDDEDKADFTWIINTDGGDDRFTVCDKDGKAELTKKSGEEILRSLGGNGGN